MYGQDSIPSVLGPLSNSMSGIKAFMKAVISRQPWLKDPLAVRKKWDEDAYALAEHGSGEKLCFAIMWNDGVVIPHPPITRALQTAKEALLAAGHTGWRQLFAPVLRTHCSLLDTVIDWQPLRHAELGDVIVRRRYIYTSKEADCSQSAIWKAGSTEDFLATTTESGEPVITTMVDGLPPADPSVRPDPAGITAYQLWQVHKRKADLRKQYLDHWQNTLNVTGTGRPVDAIIAPGAPFAATPHGKYT